MTSEWHCGLYNLFNCVYAVRYWMHAPVTHVLQPHIELEMYVGTKYFSYFAYFETEEEKDLRREKYL